MKSDLLSKLIRFGRDPSIPAAYRRAVEELLSFSSKELSAGECSRCSAPIKVHTHTLMIGQVSALADIYNAVGVGVELLSDIITDRNRQDNFQKCRYHGLIQKQITDSDGNVRWSKLDDTSKSGVWRLTKLAGKFLLGKAAIPEKAMTYRGKVVCFSDEMIDIRSKIMQWKRWEKYAKEAATLSKLLAKR